MSEGTEYRAVIADDERLLREQLKSRLAAVWPGLQVVAEARDGTEAVERVDALRPDVVFLDIRMPGLSGIEAASEILSLPDWSGVPGVASVGAPASSSGFFSSSAATKASISRLESASSLIAC